jgi:hypothetical protein
MRQSRLMSLVEAFANVAVGYGIAVLTQMAVFPLFGLNTTIGQNLAIGAIFTAVSLIRSLLRRAFEAIRVGEGSCLHWLPSGCLRSGAKSAFEKGASLGCICVIHAASESVTPSRPSCPNAAERATRAT